MLVWSIMNITRYEYWFGLISRDYQLGINQVNLSYWWMLILRESAKNLFNLSVNITMGINSKEYLLLLSIYVGLRNLKESKSTFMCAFCTSFLMNPWLWKSSYESSVAAHPKAYCNTWYPAQRTQSLMHLYSEWTTGSISEVELGCRKFKFVFESVPTDRIQ